MAELRQIHADIPPPEWIDTGDAIEGGIMLAKPGMAFEDFAKTIERAQAVFLRHLAPVQVRLDLTGTPDDVPLLVDAALDLSGRFDTGRSFAVQTRILGEGKLPYRKVTVNETISEQIEERVGAAMDCRQPEQVVSLLCTSTAGYIGVSDTASNRSAWPGGKHRFKREDGQVSRAEFKLLEAIDVFGLTLPNEGRALDMGASPGGWTRILAAAGLRVTAVDPAELDARLRGRSGIEHVRARIQDYLTSAPQFDVIVNDIKMDARASARIMVDSSGHLTPGGLAIMTLKLPKLPGTVKMGRKLLGIVSEDIDRLRQAYRVVGARQLYHNRSEVTVALTR